MSNFALWIIQKPRCNGPEYLRISYFKLCRKLFIIDVFLQKQLNEYHTQKTFHCISLQKQ